MTYPGTPSLAAEIKQRILSTFQQTLELASQGKTHEALLGCDFILRLDAGFEPARTLMGRLGESGGGTAVELADLRSLVVGPAPPPGAAPERAPAPAPAPPALSATGAQAVGGALAAGLKDLLARRELKRLVQVADENRHEVAASPELRKLVEAAYARLEAEPYVAGFLDSARMALQTGDQGEVERLLGKARSLDPTHPGLGEIEEAKKFYQDPERLLGGRRLKVSIEETPPPAGSGEEAPARDPEILQGFDLFGEEPAAPGPGGPPARGDARIAELLDDGQAAFDRGDHQAAIDAWSRIFLIDIDHQEASQRIDRARRLKAEGERRAEEAYHDALAALEAGDAEAAREGLREVLALLPGHLAARESLDQLERGAPAGPPAEAAGPLGSPLPVAGPTGEMQLKEEILVPPPPDRARPRRAPAAAPAPLAPDKKAQPLPRFAAIGGVALVLVVGVAAFLWLRWDDMFPNAGPETEVGAQAADPIARATSLYELGRTGAAVRQLRLLPPDHPRYAEAQQLIAQWEEPGEPEPEAALAEPAGPSPEALARRDRDVELARDAYAQGEYLVADARFRRAAQVAALTGTAAELAADSQQQLEPIRQQIGLFEQGEWAMALPELWRRHQAEPGNRDIVRLMVDCYYNLAVRELQRGNPAEAAKRLDEALALRPDSEALKRHRQFAQTYSRRPQDLLYRIYVRYLPLL